MVGVVTFAITANCKTSSTGASHSRCRLDNSTSVVVVKLDPWKKASSVSRSGKDGIWSRMVEVRQEVQETDARKVGIERSLALLIPESSS